MVPRRGRHGLRCLRGRGGRPAAAQDFGQRRRQHPLHRFRGRFPAAMGTGLQPRSRRPVHARRFRASGSLLLSRGGGRSRTLLLLFAGTVLPGRRGHATASRPPASAPRTRNQGRHFAADYVARSGPTSPGIGDKGARQIPHSVFPGRASAGRIGTGLLRERSALEIPRPFAMGLVVPGLLCAGIALDRVPGTPVPAKFLAAVAVVARLGLRLRAHGLCWSTHQDQVHRPCAGFFFDVCADALGLLLRAACFGAQALGFDFRLFCVRLCAQRFRFPLLCPELVGPACSRISTALFRLASSCAYGRGRLLPQ